MNKKAKLVFGSVATIAMCASLAVGGTYALFTSESRTNIAVTSGTVDVRATASDLTLYSKDVEQRGGTFELGGSATKEGNEITIERMMPMDSVNFDIEIENYSDVSVKYRTIIQSVEDTGLFSALEVTFTENGTGQVFDGGFAYADWETLVASDNDPKTSDDVSTINVNIEFPDGENQNKYQGKSCKLAVIVEAVQGNANVVNPIKKVSDYVYEVNDEKGMMLVNGVINSVAHNEATPYLEFYLTNNVDMGAYVWEPMHLHWAKFNGQGHKISNLNCGTNNVGKSGFVGYLGNGRVENLTLENVTAAGAQAGVVVGQVEDYGSIIDNVTVLGTNTVDYVPFNETWHTEEYGGVGAIVGHNNTPNATANVKIGAGAKITVNYNNQTNIGFKQQGDKYAFANKLSGTIVDNGTVTTVGSYLFRVADGVFQAQDGKYLISNANGLKYFSGQALTKNDKVAEMVTIALLNDIDMENAEFSAICTQRGDVLVFEGNGYTISNVNVISGENDNTTKQASMFYTYPNSTLSVSNLTLSNIKVTTEMDADSANYGAAVVGYAEGSIDLKSVHVVNADVVGAKSSGVLVGHLSGTLEAANCSVKNSTVTITDSVEVEGHYAGKAIGTIAGSATLTNCTFDATVKGNLHADNVGETYGRMTSAGTLNGMKNLPNAKIENLDPEFFNEGIRSDAQLNNLGIEVDFAMNFAAPATSSDECQNYYVDFEITFSEDVFVGNVIMIGHYDSFGTMPIAAISVADENGMVKAGTYRVMSELFVFPGSSGSGLEITYEFIDEIVKDFKCGVIICNVNYDEDYDGVEVTNASGTVFNAPEDLVITLELKMYETNSYENGVRIGGAITYEYDGDAPTVDYSTMCEILMGSVNSL